MKLEKIILSEYTQNQKISIVCILLYVDVILKVFNRHTTIHVT